MKTTFRLIFSAVIMIIITATFSPTSVKACDIWEVQADVMPCNDDGVFYVLLTFEFAETGNEGFRIQGDGINYGNFSYENLPVEIGPLEGDGVTEYEFVVIDNQFGDCSAWTAIDPVSCDNNGDCAIWDVEAAVMPCNDDNMFWVNLNFEFENVGQEGFRVQGNGNNYSNFSYENLPVEIGPLEGDGVTEYEFVVIDNQFGDCSAWTAIDPVSCDNNGDCAIWEVEADVMPCNDDNMFWVHLNFEFENVGQEGFRVQGNGNNYGTFWYDNLPVEIGPLAGDGVTVYEFVVIDNQYEDCSAWTAIDPVNCEGSGDCFIGELNIDDHPCNDDGYFYAMLDFEYENVGNAGFNVYANDQYLGTFNYESLPVDVGPLLGDGETVYNFLVVDAEHVSCCNWRAIDPVSCDGGGDCLIGEIMKEIEPCNEAGNFFVVLNFEFANVSDEGFSVHVNDSHFGNFNYGQLPIEIGPLDGDGITAYSFWVSDLVYDDCHNSTSIEPINCDGNNCNIWDLLGEVLLCNDQGNFFVELDFEYENVSEQGFALYINDDFIGNHEYGALPIEVGPLVGNGTTEYVISVSDNVIDDCGGNLTIEPVDCDPDNFFGGDEQIVIYPNPSKGTLNFKFKEDLMKPLSLFIYNSKGEEIFNSKNIIDNEYEVNFSKMRGGIYFYKIKNTNGVYKGKIVVN